MRKLFDCFGDWLIFSFLVFCAWNQYCVFFWLENFPSLVKITPPLHTHNLLIYGLLYRATINLLRLTFALAARTRGMFPPSRAPCYTCAQLAPQLLPVQLRAARQVERDVVAFLFLPPPPALYFYYRLQ